MTPQEIFLLESEHQAVAMGRGDVVKIIFLDADVSQAKLECLTLGLCYLGCFGLKDGHFACSPVESASASMTLQAGKMYGEQLAARLRGDSASWLQKLWDLNDPRLDN
jgi:hypothetical protein